MTTQEYKRRLSAILSADVKGYSRLMRDDEEATVRTLTTHRTAMTHLIEQYRGRVVDSPGDNILAEFTSVVDAVNCAVEIQRELAERNAELPENRRMQFRIGINLGDVLEEGMRIYGDGVNIAARMEGLAEAGGICVSGTVFDAIQNKIGLEYEYLGEHDVKNIDTPVRAYRVLSFPGAAAHRVVKAKKAVWRSWRNAMLAAAVILLVVAALALWQFYWRSPRFEPVSKEKMAVQVPDKPSIAVLPFTNMSDDPKQEYFSDGLTESIITALSKTPKLLVIARNSTFTYKGKAVKVQQVARELGVRYVLEGSVRRSEGRVRITAQLIDATTGNHLWAEQYDRGLKDVFALQDEITIKIITALQVKLTKGEIARMTARGTDNLEAFLKASEGLEYFYRMNKADNLKARQLLEEAIALDPNYAYGYSILGWTYMRDVMFGWAESPKVSLEKASVLGQKAVSLDDGQESAHRLLGLVYLWTRQPDKAMAEHERAIALAPNSSNALAEMGGLLRAMGRFREVIKSYETAIRLDPFPQASFFLNSAYAYFYTGRTNEAIEVANKAINLFPGIAEPHFLLGIAFIAAGKSGEALAEFDKALSLTQSPSSWHIANKAFALLNTGKIEEAVASMKDLVSSRPDDAWCYMYLVHALNLVGKYEEALEVAQKTVTLQINPYGTEPLIKLASGWSYGFMGQYDQAIAQLKEAIKLWPDFVWGHLGLSAFYSLAGRAEEAHAEVLEILKINPRISLADIARDGYLNFKTADKNRFLDALRNAGLK
jgi:TolB-like protein/class 3 adenylate cyclase/Flp pilus assembly protein TadD